MPTLASHRRRLGVIVALAALALAGLAPTAFARYVYTGNYDAGTVSLIDTSTNQVVGAPIPVGQGPYNLAITPNGKTVYVVSQGGENLTAIDTQVNQPVGPIPLGGPAAEIAVSPDGSTAYVTRQKTKGVLVLDTATNQFAAAAIEVGSENLYGVAFMPDGKSAYVTDLEGKSIRVVDTATRQVVGAPIPVGADPINVAFTPDGRFAYVTNEDDGTVSVIDTQTRQPIATIPIGGEDLWGLAITPDGTRAYVSDYITDRVYAIDTATRQVIGGPIAVADTPYEIAITPNGRTAYVASYEKAGAGGTVTAIDVGTNQVTATIPVAGGPWQPAIAPNQSPLASFTAKTSRTSTQVSFKGAGSSDPDGLVQTFNWSFGDRTTAAAAGPGPKHRYKKGGKYPAGLTVVDNEGCSTAQVFTGRTAYCSGSPLSAQTKTVRVNPNGFKFGRLTRNAKKGTAKLKVKLPAPGKLTLSGRQVKRVKRSARKAGTLVLIVKVKAKLREALEREGHAKAKVRVTFKPSGGTARSQGKTVSLLVR